MGNPHDRFSDAFDQKGQAVVQQANVAQTDPVSTYQTAVNNVAGYIRAGGSVDAFVASTVLAVAFGMKKEHVINDIVMANRV